MRLIGKWAFGRRDAARQEGLKAGQKAVRKKAPASIVPPCIHACSREVFRF